MKYHLKKNGTNSKLNIPYIIPAFSTGNIYFQMIISRLLCSVIFVKMLFHTEKISLLKHAVYILDGRNFLSVSKSW